MKKFFAVLLAFIMVFSMSSVGLAADDSIFDDAVNSYLNSLPSGLQASINLDNGSDVEAMINAGVIDNVDFLGMTIADLYNSQTAINWNSLGISKNAALITAANINTYLKNALVDIIEDETSTRRFINAANCTKITNIIGHILDPDFVDVTIQDLDVDNSGPYYDSFDVTNVFYTKIARYSGLMDIMQTNWFNTNVNYLPLLYLIDFQFSDDMLKGKHSTDAERMAPVFVKSVFASIVRKGPYSFALDLLAQICATYGSGMFEPIKALLIANITKGNITEDELKTVKGLLNVLVNNNNKSRTDRLQFISVPTYRFASCVDGTKVDTAQMFMCSTFYLTLVGKYGNNNTAITALKNKVNSTANIDATQKQNINAIIDGILSNNIDALVAQMGPITNDNIDQAGNNIYDSFINFFRNFWKNISNIISKFFNSMANFGRM